MGQQKNSQPQSCYGNPNYPNHCSPNLISAGKMKVKIVGGLI